MTIKLKYKPDFEEAYKYWEAFWQKQIIDRPCIVVTAPKDGCAQAPKPPYMAGSDGQYENAIKMFDEWAATTFFGAEAIPFFDITFGPDQFSAFLGAKIDYSSREFGTSWAIPFVEDWKEKPPLQLQADNPVWKEMLKFLRVTARVSKELRGNLMGR